MILRQPYGASVDFWQYGCFVYELYAGRSPFWLPRKPRKFIRDNILNGVFAYPSVVPEAARGITGALLQVHFRLPLVVEEITTNVFRCTFSVDSGPCFDSVDTGEFTLFRVILIKEPLNK